MRSWSCSGAGCRAARVRRAGRGVALLVLFGEFGGEFGAAGASGEQGVAAGKGPVVVLAGAVGFAGQGGGFLDQLRAGAFEVAGAVLQLDDDAQRAIGTQFVEADADVGQRYAVEFDGEVRFEVVARGGDDVEPDDDSDMVGLS